MNSPSSSAPGARRGSDFSQDLAKKGWYHSFEFADGSSIDGYMGLEVQKERYAHFPIPRDLTGKRVLDIGAWDGWFSFEAEMHSGEVVAIDCVELPSFLEVHRKLRSKVDYKIFDFYELPDAGLGKFEVVFFLGVLYHLRHPLLALEIVCGLTLETAIVDSYVTDAESWREHKDDIPSMEFYELEELGNQFDCWVGPTVSCLIAMCRAAGFARVELLSTTNSHATIACHRVWEASPILFTSDAPVLISVENSRTFGINFSSRKSEEYIRCMFQASKHSIAREDLCLEVDSFGAAALIVNPEADAIWIATFRLPPGLNQGWHTVKLRFADSGFSSESQIAVDILPKAQRITLVRVCDGITWRDGEVKIDDLGYVTCWASGFPENADRANVRVNLDGVKLAVNWVGPVDEKGLRQINAVVPRGTARTSQSVVIDSGGTRSEPWPIKIF